MSTIDACIAILKGMLPQDRFEYKQRDNDWWEPSHPSRSRTFDIWAYPPRFSDLLLPKKLHFEVYLYDDHLIAQEISTNGSVVDRHEINLADPDCFEKVYAFITRRYLA